jgi:hypothetical protein
MFFLRYVEENPSSKTEDIAKRFGANMKRWIKQKIELLHELYNAIYAFFTIS